MLYVIQKGFNQVKPTPAENIVYCVSTVQEIIDSHLNFVFTDGHAVDSFSSLYTINDIANIDNILDIAAINSKFWKDGNDLDKKRRKEAEFLVLGDIPKQAIIGYIVFNKKAKNRLIESGVTINTVHVKPNYYF